MPTVKQMYNEITDMDMFNGDASEVLPLKNFFLRRNARCWYVEGLDINNPRYHSSNPLYYTCRVTIGYTGNLDLDYIIGSGWTMKEAITVLLNKIKQEQMTCVK